jgi:hypothetical protein
VFILSLHVYAKDRKEDVHEMSDDIITSQCTGIYTMPSSRSVVPGRLLVGAYMHACVHTCIHTRARFFSTNDLNMYVQAAGDLSDH